MNANVVILPIVAEVSAHRRGMMCANVVIASRDRSANVVVLPVVARVSSSRGKTTRRTCPPLLAMSDRSRSPPTKWLEPARWAPHKFKTTMCTFFQDNQCKRGDACKFAHWEEELRVVGEKLRGEERRKYIMGARQPSSKPLEEISSEAASSSRDVRTDHWRAEVVAGDVIGDAVCIGKASTFGPTIWIGTVADAENGKFLDEQKISVVVRCKSGYPREYPESTRPRYWVNGSCWDIPPGTFPFVPQRGTTDVELFNAALVNMCAQIDRHVDDGHVLFHCKAGKHRSFAAAIAYMMWSVRSVSFATVRDHIQQYHRRFELGERGRVIHGRVRRGLTPELQDWEQYLAKHMPRSILHEIPVNMARPRVDSYQ